MKHRCLTMLLALLLVGSLPLRAQETVCEAGFRLIVHELGENCVPENVERVVTLENWQ